jgi:hypothetical protein
MADAVDEVVGEGVAEGKLDARLDGEGQVGEEGGDAGALEVPAEQRGDEVGGEESVRGTREGAAGDAGPGRVAEPDLVDLVDAQVGRDGAVEALLDEDLMALGGVELSRRDGAVTWAESERALAAVGPWRFMILCSADWLTVESS